jgi:hypothetical protein
MDEVKTKANCRFTDWWRLLNAEMGKLHHGQEVLFRDARDSYEAGQSPETAAKELWVQWSK